MRYLKLLPAMLLAIMLYGCGGGDQSDQDTMDKAADKTQEAMDKAQQGAEKAWDETKEGAQQVKEKASEAMDQGDDQSTWEKTKEGAGEAWQSTKEGAKKAWSATKEYSQQAWEQVRESFKGDMTPEQHAQFEECVDKLQSDEGLTEDQAERGCWRMMEEGTLSSYLAGKASGEADGN